MKTSYMDYLLSFFNMGVLLAAAFMSSWALSIDNEWHVLLDVLVFLLAYGVYTAFYLALIRHFRPYPLGSYGMDSCKFVYWKQVALLINLAEKALGPFLTLFNKPLYHKIMGAHVGRQVALAGGTLCDQPLLYFDDYSVVGAGSVVTAHAISGNQILLAPIKLGKSAVIGVNCTVLPGVELGDHAVLAPGAVATVNSKIPAHELWGGIPARFIKRLD